MNSYKALNKQIFTSGNYSIVPIRFEDRFDIMKWRNEQIYHLRQAKPLTEEDQTNYFNNVVAKLFEQEQPNQILFSFLKNNVCIGYGGLVHINWIDKNAEISFIMNSELESEYFDIIWTVYLKQIEKVAFKDLKLHKIFTYAFNLRPHLYSTLEHANFNQEAILKEHGQFKNKYIDVYIHSKINSGITLRKASLNDNETTYNWATNPEVRKYSFDKSTILFEAHSNWFQSKLNSSNCIYYIAEIDNQPIGSIRFDIDETMNATVSYLLDPNYHGKGYGKTLLFEGAKNLIVERKDIHTLIGFVIKENKASIKIFEKLGYDKSELDSSNLRFTKKTNSNAN